MGLGQWWEAGIVARIIRCIANAMLVAVIMNISTVDADLEDISSFWLILMLDNVVLARCHLQLLHQKLITTYISTNR